VTPPSHSGFAARLDLTQASSRRTAASAKQSRIRGIGFQPARHSHVALVFLRHHDFGATRTDGSFIENRLVTLRLRASFSLAILVNFIEQPVFFVGRQIREGASRGFRAARCPSRWRAGELFRTKNDFDSPPIFESGFIFQFDGFSVNDAV
jgi:hypothetical protein